MADKPDITDKNEPVESDSLSAPASMRQAREAAGLTLEDVAMQTRVPLRHLASLESGDYDALPGTTYCAGFARAFARVVGMDEATLVAKIREEIAEQGGASQGYYEIEEPVDPSSVPSRFIAAIALIFVLLLAGGYAVWRMQINTPPTDEQLAAEQRTETRIADPAAPKAPAKAPAAAVAPTGPVVMTAVNEVWMRIYQPDGKRLFEGTLAKDKSFTIPADASNPMILTGRPDALSVTVGGQAIPPLGTAERTIVDVPVSAAALAARSTVPAQDEEGMAPPTNAATPATIG